METYKYSFELKSHLSELKTLYQHLNNFGQITGISEDCISKINICLDELFTNIVLYGYTDDLDHIVSFKMKMNSNVLIVNIEDDGIPFNPLQKKDPEIPADIINAKIGGLGIYITKKFMDDISYKRKRGKNKLTMKKFTRTTRYLYQNGKTIQEPLNCLTRYH
jgi:anti-sigma regulatory factor (Ser/Thr protein kinase)